MSTLKSRALDYTSRLLLLPQVRRIGRKSPRPQAGQSGEVENLNQSGHGPQETGGSELPVELLLQIFDHVPATDIIRYRAVCKQFRQIVDYTPEMQYKIELYVSGYQDNEANTSMGVSAKLEALRSHHRWESMRDWTWEHIELLGWDPRIVETSHYSGNVWVQYLQWLNITIGGAAGPDGDFTETCEAKCVAFEKAADGTPIADSWTLSFSESARFDDYIADVSQNTLYLIGTAVVEGQRCRKVRTVSLTNGLILSEQLFPASREQDPVPGHIPTRELSVHKPHGRSIIAYLELVGIHGADRVQAEIGLLDLESGEVIDTLSRHMPRKQKLRFVTETMFLLHVMDGGKFSTEVYVLTRSTSSHKEKIHHLATLKYPTVRRAYLGKPGILSGIFDCAQDTTESGWLTRNAPPPPFLRSHEPPLVTIYRKFRGVQLLHCIPTSVFTSIAGRQGSIDLSAEPAVFRWKSWGPDNTRCFIHTSPWPNDCAPATFGYKVLNRDLSMLDFSQLDIARDLQRINMTAAHLEDFTGSLEDVDIPDTDIRIIRSPTVIPRGEIFDKDILTTLPYKKIQIDWDWDFPTPSYLYGGETWIAASRFGGTGNWPHQLAYHALVHKSAKLAEAVGSHNTAGSEN